MRGPGLGRGGHINFSASISLHHLPDDVYAHAVGVFSEQELVDLNLTIMSINSWNRLAIAFRYQPDRE